MIILKTRSIPHKIGNKQILILFMTTKIHTNFIVKVIENIDAMRP